MQSDQLTAALTVLKAMAQGDFATGVQFYLHKANLAASSHVFNDMMELSTAAGGTVTLEETAEVLEIVLPYVYLDALPYFKLEFPKSFMVLKALDKYGIWRGIEAIKVAFRDRYLGVEGTTADFAQDVYTYLAAVQLQDSRLEKLAIMRIVDAEPTVDELRATSARHAGYFKSRTRSVGNWSRTSWHTGFASRRFSSATRFPRSSFAGTLWEPKYKGCTAEGTLLKARAHAGKITSLTNLTAYVNGGAAGVACTAGYSGNLSSGQQCLDRRQNSFAVLLTDVKALVRVL